MGSYKAKNLKVLEGLDAVRKRPGMYIGSTGQSGLQHCLWEIIDNAVDEAGAGFCDHITVTLHADGSAEITDNGRGIPVDKEPSTGLSGVELVFTKLHAGGKFGSESYTSSGGLHGVGSSVVNALSSKVSVQVRRDGYSWLLDFNNAVPGHFKNSTFTEGSLKKGTKTTKTGTTVRFWPDHNVFEDNTFSYEELKKRAQQTAYLLPGLTIELVNLTEQPGGPDTFCYAGGIVDMVEDMAKNKTLSPIYSIDKTSQFEESIHDPDAEGGRSTVVRKVRVRASWAWSKDWESDVRSFVNTIETVSGGTHKTGFEKALQKTITEQLSGSRVWKLEENPTWADISEGLKAVISVEFGEPQFEGQTKAALGTKEILPIVSKETYEYANKVLNRNKQEAKPVLERIVNAVKTRVAAKKLRDSKRKINALGQSTMPAKLVDCRSKNTDERELFIVEGDSALGTFKGGRDSYFQAALPIRGKILNVFKKSETEMLKSSEIADIIQVIGAGVGKHFDISKARYGKLILLTDADVDGAHIRTLLISLAYRYMYPLLESGCVYSAVPPLHQIKAGGGKNQKIYYTYSDSELDKKLKTLKTTAVTVQRYKGLGEMNAEQLAETTLDPGKRILRRIEVEDAEKMSQMFDILMGSNVAIRKQFIVDNALDIDENLIDT